MIVVVTGGTGFVGRDLIHVLLTRGDTVRLVTRRPEVVAEDQTLRGVETVSWDDLDLSGVDAVVHLAGENLFGRRWNAEHKKRILESRTEGSHRVVEAIERASPRPNVLVHASGVGIFGDRGDEELVEGSASGSDFLADVCKQWEAACAKARDSGLRVAAMRLGIVLDKGGGALAKMQTPFTFFVGGPIGNGAQWMSWIHRRDVSRMFAMAIDDGRVNGPVNVVAPHPVRMDTFAKAFGKAKRRPAWFRVPGFAIKLALGEVATVLLTGQRVLPQRARELGFEFEFSELSEALEQIVARS